MQRQNMLLEFLFLLNCVLTLGMPFWEKKKHYFIMSCYYSTKTIANILATLARVAAHNSWEICLEPVKLSKHRQQIRSCRVIVYAVQAVPQLAQSGV